MNQNLDEQELAKFAALANEWWDPQGKLSTLHHINPIRCQYIKEKVNFNHPDLCILDIGCGGGILTESLAAGGAKVTGIDLNPSLLEIAKTHACTQTPPMRLDYRLVSAEALAEAEPQSVDIITCLEMLEHVPDPSAIVKACARLLKPGGHVFFSTINRHPKAYLYAILGAEYVLNLLPRGTHDYAKFIRPAELSAWVREASLLPQDIRGVTYHPLTKQCTFTKSVSVNYLFYAIKS